LKSLTGNFRFNNGSRKYGNIFLIGGNYNFVTVKNKIGNFIKKYFLFGKSLEFFSVFDYDKRHTAKRRYGSGTYVKNKVCRSR